jgi:small subunit ribosomal protein S16
MLTLRLARAGTKKRPVYHLVATDSRSRRDGRFIENLGYYIPSRNVLVLKHDRIEHWLSVGARTSETAGQIIAKSKRHGNMMPAAKPKYQAPASPKPVVVETPKAPENAVEKTE